MYRNYQSQRGAPGFLPVADPYRGGQPIMRHDTQTFNAAAMPSVYGNTPPLFDCYASDAVVSLSYANRTSPLMDWIGWERTDIVRIQEYFLTYAAPSGTGAGTPSNGWITDPCAPGQGVEWGATDFVVEGFGRIRRTSPTRDATVLDLKYYERQPRYRMDGSVIADDVEWDLNIMAAAMLHDLHRMLIIGNKTTAGQFDGLQQLVNYGYQSSAGVAASSMDSFVINWNSNGMCAPNTAPTGVTYNGGALTLGAGITFIDMLESVVRRIQQRINLSDGYNGAISGGDMVLVLPWDMVECLLDCYTCWRVCSSDITRVDSFEARNFRRSLEGGVYGAGAITVGNVTIPLMPYDYELLHSSGVKGDIFLLTRGIGGATFIRGQYNDLNNAARRLTGGHVATDNGLILHWSNEDNMCITSHAELQPRLLLRAPWAQARFTNVACTPILGAPLSGDPLSAFFIESNIDNQTMASTA